MTITHTDFLQISYFFVYEGVTFFISYLVYLFVEYPFASMLSSLTEKVRAREAESGTQLEENNNHVTKDSIDSGSCSHTEKCSSNLECDSAQTTPTRVRRRSVSFVTRKSEERIIGGNFDVPKSIVDNE